MSECKLLFYACDGCGRKKDNASDIKNWISVKAKEFKINDILIAENMNYHFCSTDCLISFIINNID